MAQPEMDSIPGAPPGDLSRAMLPKNMVAVVIGLRYSAAPRLAVRLGWVVLVGLGLQGVIGYVQYFNHLPAGLVWVHVVTSVLLWICVLRLYLATRTRAPLPAEPAPAPAEGSAVVA